MFVVPFHGGHLGFFEGGFLSVYPLTWLDKALMQYIIAVVKANQSVDKLEISSCNQADDYVVAS